MIFQFTVPILIIVSALMIGIGILLTVTFWNFSKIMFWRIPTKDKQSAFFEVERSIYDVTGSIYPDDVKIWIPSRHA